jgi:hypothetical protein
MVARVVLSRSQPGQLVTDARRGIGKRFGGALHVRLLFANI